LILCGAFVGAASESDRPPSALLWLDGPSEVAAVGYEFTVAVRLDDISNVYGIDISLSFDETSLEVLDDGGAPGIQISVGDCPAPDFVVANTADNTAGTIHYAVTQLAPTPPCSGGLVAEIRFRAISSGPSVVEFTASIVSDPNGLPLAHETQDLAINVGYGGTLELIGPGAAVQVGDEFTAEIQLSGVDDVYGVQIALSFDETCLEVLDDGGAPGIQILPGDCPQPDFVVQNAADNTAGTIEYAVTQLNPTPACSGGLVATIRFRALLAATTLVQFTSSIVSDPLGAEIPHVTQDLSVTIESTPALLWLNGPDDPVPVGDEFPVSLLLGYLSDVFGAEVSLGFDPTYLEVLDDGAAPGIQITPGDCPQPDFVVQNAADNVAGTIDYAVTQLAPTPPCDGGVVAVMRLVGLQAGETEIQIVESVIANPDGLPLAHDTQNVIISVGGSPVEQMSWGTMKALYR
jgi:hypothetical protein